MRHLLFILFIPALLLCCDPLARPGHGPVSFSADTISFDTVFSSTGSSTRELRVINKGSDPLLIDRIFLGGGSGSPFRLNIDGAPATEKERTVLAGGDSIFIFVDVNIDPNGEASPLAVLDSVVFESGSFSGRVILEAWGQDIWLFDDVITGTERWTAGKPYVIKGSLTVDTAETLTLEAGTRVYFHYGASMTVAGRIVAEGKADSPVLMATDRLEPGYEDVPGRWKGISFPDCSSGGMLVYTEVRNARLALAISGNRSSVTELRLENVKLMHNTVAALAAWDAEVFAVNSLFAHTGFSTVYLSGRGVYEFIHCTLANRWEYGLRSEPVMFVGVSGGNLPEVAVTNTVISGNLTNELFIDATSEMAAGRFMADSSLIKVDTTRSTWYTSALFRHVITKPDPRFIEESTYDYRPDTLSPLLDISGKSEAVSWPHDIRNMSRPTGAGPDIGAYERQPGEKTRDER